MIITYKDQGKTLGQLTREIKEKVNKKICYIGRLDPIASGFICYLEDEECKSASSLLKFDKTYQFNLVLGISTDTGDPLGKIEKLEDCDEINEDFVDLFNDFSYIQKYPVYSSFVIKKDGLKKPLWYFAKNCIKLEEYEVPEHRVHIKLLEIVGDIFFINQTKYFEEQIEKLDDEKGECFRKSDVLKQYRNLGEIKLIGIPMIAKVSSGTYIRKLCEDIGKYVGIPAIADRIERIAFHFPEKINNYEVL